MITFIEPFFLFTFRFQQPATGKRVSLSNLTFTNISYHCNAEVQYKIIHSVT